MLSGARLRVFQLWILVAVVVVVKHCVDDQVSVFVVIVLFALHGVIM